MVAYLFTEVTPEEEPPEDEAPDEEPLDEEVLAPDELLEDDVLPPPAEELLDEAPDDEVVPPDELLEDQVPCAVAVTGEEPPPQADTSTAKAAAIVSAESVVNFDCRRCALSCDSR